MFLTGLSSFSYAQKVKVCKAVSTPASFPNANSIWKSDSSIILEAKNGIYINTSNTYNFFPFNEKNESIANIKIRGNSLYIITRKTRGYSLYRYDFSSHTLKIVYKKDLSFQLNNRQYSSTLVDILFFKDKVYLVTNFDLLIFDEASFFNNGDYFQREKLIPLQGSRPDRIVDLRLVNEQLQILAFQRGDYQQPYILHKKTLGSNNQIPAQYLSSVYMKKIDNNTENPLFIFGSKNNSTVLPLNSNNQIFVEGYITYAFFESSHIKKGYGLVQVNGREVNLLRDGKVLCQSNLVASQFVIIQSLPGALRILAKGSSGKISEHLILLN